VSLYPSPSLSPYQNVSPSLGVIREEIRALGLLTAEGADIVVVPVRALFSRLPKPETFAGRIVTLRQNDDIDPHSLLQQFVENGFVRTDLVGEAGEFAFRGGILDVFPPNTPKPLRVELFGDTIESLRWFDVETQRSDEAAPEGASILPMTHFPVTRETRSALARRLSLDFMEPIFKRDVADKIERLNEHGTFPGIEHYMPVAVETSSFADMIGSWELVLIEPDQITTAISKFESLLRNEYEAAAENGHAVYAPERITTPGPEVLHFLARARLAMSEVHIASKEFAELRVHAGQVDRYTNRLTEFAADFRANDRNQIFLTATKGGHEKVERLFKEFYLPVGIITTARLPRGFHFDEI
jgi:transcription-repair coupling factor (superfamily II helicase)